MTNRRTLLWLDVVMFGSFAVLMSWRLTGVAAHEWIGLTLIALIVLHLLLHWGWVESQIENAVRARRRVTPLLLNAGLFLAMGTALVSGVVVSKVVVPNRLTPADYLRWHGLHETSSTITAIILGLHVALNWDRILGALRRARSHAGRWQLHPRTVLRRVAWIAVVSVVLVGTVWEVGRRLPGSTEVLMVYPDGHRERRAPPPEITRLMPGANRPDGRGAIRTVMSLVLVSVAAVVGRRVLKLRLTRRPAGRARGGSEFQAARPDVL